MLQIRKIYDLLPKNKIQVGMFSARMPREALDMTRKFIKKPVRIVVERDEQVTLEDVEQYYVDVDKEERKFETLWELYEPFAIPP